jgi:hypothetical protein
MHTHDMVHRKWPHGSRDIGGRVHYTQRPEDNAPPGFGNIHPRVPRWYETAPSSHFSAKFFHATFKLRTAIRIELFDATTGKILHVIGKELLADAKVFLCCGSFAKIHRNKFRACVIEYVHLGKSKGRGFGHNTRVRVYALPETSECLWLTSAMPVAAECTTNARKAWFGLARHIPKRGNILALDKLRRSGNAVRGEVAKSVMAKIPGERERLLQRGSGLHARWLIMAALTTQQSIENSTLRPCGNLGTATGARGAR